ncbi:MAG: methyltransferase domain-containing protein [Ilumatobacteraceae bacterium]
MHDSSYEKMAAFVSIHLGASRGQPLEILDFGSQTVDEQPRSYRDLFDDPNWTYRGLDIEAGANVDVVVGDAYDWAEIQSDSVDLIVSGQAFEHVEYFWASMFEIVRALKPGGLAVIIAPSNGFEHRYPVDCWRFYQDGFSALAHHVGCEVVDVFTDWNRAVWADSILVARKPLLDDTGRRRFLERAAMQRALLSPAGVDLDGLRSAREQPLPEVTASNITTADAGALETELQAIRDRHLAAEQAARDASVAAPASAPPNVFVATYGRVRAKVASVAGPAGRDAYKRLRGRA